MNSGLRALIIIRTIVGESLEHLADPIRLFVENKYAVKVSNVYRKIDLNDSTKRSGSLVVAAQVVGFLDPESLQKQIDTYVFNHPNTVEIDLLIFELQTRMTPGMTLPHPEFHRLPEMVIPAAEIMGDAPHPVLNQTLNELRDKIMTQSWGEFFAQGQKLVEIFSKAKS